MTPERLEKGLRAVAASSARRHLRAGGDPVHRVGGAKKPSRGQDCPLLDSRLRENDTVGVECSQTLMVSLSNHEG